MRVAAVAALMAVALASCVDAKPSSPTPEDLAEADLSPDHTITVDADGYDPSTLEVEGGEVILLVNEGDEAHSFTANDQEFDTGLMLPSEETTLVLVEPGRTTFHDIEAPDHEGTISVVEGQ